MYWKVLDQDGLTYFEKEEIDLPEKDGKGDWISGDWTERIDNLIMHQRGWHLLTNPRVILMNYGDGSCSGDVFRTGNTRVFKAEIRGDYKEFQGKVCAESIRLIEEHHLTVKTSY